MIILDYKDTRPIYEQIVDKLENLILKGILQKDEKMPSVRSFAVELSINPNTIQKAYSELERRGFLYTVKGRGNYVALSKELYQIKQDEAKEKLKAVVKEARELGVTREEMVKYLINEEEQYD